MANECCGTLRVVTHKKEVLDRLHEIGNYRDKEYGLSRCFSFIPIDPAVKTEDFFVQDFSVVGAWSCSRFFTDEEDLTDINKRSGSHLANLVVLAKRLDFGAELFAEEVGCGFCEHLAVNHKGELFVEQYADYEERYPLGEDGEPDYDADCQYYYGDLNKNYGDYMPAKKIYG